MESFGLVLELALGGPPGDGWREIVSPRLELIDLALQLLGKD